MNKTIQIKCDGIPTIPFKDLKNFQGNLKDLRKDEFDKLKNSILKYGFRIPIFVWKNNILDGHQRIFVIKKLIEDGYILDGGIPAINIQAENKKEARTILLLINSKYGKTTYEGLYEFIETSEINFDSIKNDIELSDIDLDNFEQGFYKESPIKKGKGHEPTITVKYKCPKCGHEWK